MARTLNGWSSLMAVAVAVALAAGLVPLASSAGPVPSPGDQQRIRRLVRTHLTLPRQSYSGGLRGWLNPPDPGDVELVPSPRMPALGSNVDANDPTLDLGGGQAEVAIAANGNRVVASWNDASGFLAPGQTLPSLSGAAYSDDRGASFSDLVGLPNTDPQQSWSGDPTVAAIDPNHFVVGGLYFPGFFANCKAGPVRLSMALTVGTVQPSGPPISFGAPIEPINPGDVCGRHPSNTAGLLDKEFMAYEPTTRTLAVSYTRYFFFGRHTGLGQIEVAIATVPEDPTQLSAADFRKVIVWREERYCDFPDELPSEAAQCSAQNAGAYPAISPDGDVYVVWERNIDTLLYSGDPYAYIHAAVIQAGATTPSRGGNDDPVVVTLGQVNGNKEGGVHSLNAQFIAGFNRGLGNDFPRIAFDPVGNQAIVVWNDASLHPLGDIWLRALTSGLTSLGAIRRVNDDESFALHFLPAVSVGTDGSIRTSWYDRRLAGADSTETEYLGEIRPNAATNAVDFPISTGSSDWSGTSSLIVPNFGDYTDNFTTGTRTYYIWTDGRLGVPQPFVDTRN